MYVCIYKHILKGKALGSICFYFWVFLALPFSSRSDETGGVKGATGGEGTGEGQWLYVNYDIGKHTHSSHNSETVKYLE